MHAIDLSLTAELKTDALPEGALTVDLGLYEGQLSLTDPLRFHATMRAIDHYKWRSNQPICLFTMKAPLSQLIRPVDLIERFPEWQKDHNEGDIELFARDMLVDFLQLLMPAFPEEAPLSVTLDSQFYDEAVFLRLSHPAKWAELYAGQPATTAMLLPPAEEIRLSIYEEIAALAKAHNITYFLTEEQFHHSWQGLDVVYVTRHLSSRGERALKGFEAALGKVVRQEQI